MHYLPIDKHCHIKSFIHALDPRVKIVSLLIYVVTLVSTRPEAYISFLFYGVLLLLLLFLSKIPPAYVLKRSMVVIPFALLTTIFLPFLKEGEILRRYSFGCFNLSVSREGLMLTWNVLVKSYLSIVTVIVLIGSGSFADILKGLERLGVPSIFIMIISFMYRYIFIIGGTLASMKIAKDSRSVGGTRRRQTKALANMLGTLFIRSYERGEKVYLAMCARGFDGGIRTIDNFSLSRRDIVFLLATISFLGMGRFGFYV